MIRTSIWLLAIAGCAALANAQCDQASIVGGTQSDDCAFSYTNIRLESVTPEGFLNHGGSGGDVVTDPAVPPGDTLLAEVEVEETPASNSASNPFSNVDLSSFSQEDLEARRELLLSILAQTNEELGVPPMPRSFVVEPANVVEEDVAIDVAVDDAAGEGVIEKADGADTVVETDEAETVEAEEEAVEEEAVEEEAGTSATKDTRAAETGSSSFFKNLLGGSSNPTSSAFAAPAFASAAAAAVTMLLLTV
jgi:hypothetical protein